MTDFQVKKGWEDTLLSLGLDSLESLLAYKNENCTSEHRRGATFRIELPGESGECLYLKCDYFTHKKEVLKDILRFRRPGQNSVKERHAFEHAAKAGFIVPEVVAWGKCSWFGIPDKAAMVMRGIQGVNLEKHLKSGGDIKYIEIADRLLRSFFQCGFDWPDYKPEHFIIMPDGRLALIDLERMRVLSKKLSEEQIEKRMARFHRMANGFVNK